MPRSPNRQQGHAAVVFAAEQYGLEVDEETTEWYDAVDPSTGTKYEVKSTSVKLGNGAVGRFRLWEDQHRSLLSSNASGTAWYVFVVFGGSEVVGFRRMRPQTVTQHVPQWNQAGHEDRESRQYKLPWPEVVDA